MNAELGLAINGSVVRVPFLRKGKPYLTVRPHALSYRATDAALRYREGIPANERTAPEVYRSMRRMLLSAVIPRRWWHRFGFDPVAILGNDDAGVAEKLLDAATARPWEGILLSSLAPRRPMEALPRGAALEAAEDALLREHGATWLHDPERWPTADGYVPVGVFLAALDALPPASPLSGDLH